MPRRAGECGCEGEGWVAKFVPPLGRPAAVRDGLVYKARLRTSPASGNG